MKIRKGMRKNEGAWVTILEHLVVLILIGFVQPENKDKYIWESLHIEIHKSRHNLRKTHDLDLGFVPNLLYL